MSKKKSIFTLVIFYLLTCGSAARAEYRLYRLKITDLQSHASRNVTTTLDNIQYRGYFPVRKNEIVTIEAHWMCWDQPGEARPRPYCPPPPPPAAPKTN